MQQTSSCLHLVVHANGSSVTFGQSGNCLIVPCTHSCQKASKSGHLPEDYEIQKLLASYRKGLKIIYSVLYNTASD